VSTVIDEALPTTLAAAEDAVDESVAHGPARFDLTFEQRQAWADRHRVLLARRNALRAARDRGVA
jgi:hypothetical protein